MVKLNDYVSAPDAADLIGCTRSRIYQMLRDGDFRDVIQVGKHGTLIARKEAEQVARNPAATGRPRKKPA